MRWRLFLFFLIVTAAFCFLLLTAVTDHGSTGQHHSPLVSAASADHRPVFLAATSARQPAVTERASLRHASDTPFDPGIRPAAARLFVTHNADPIRDREELEKLSPATSTRLNIAFG